MEQESADFLASGDIDGKQFTSSVPRVQEIMAELRPNAVALVDAFAVPDYLLNSALAVRTATSTRRLFDFALREPPTRQVNVDINDLETTDIDSDLPRSKL